MTQGNVHVLILTGFGLNCDYETATVFELAGAVAHRVHINALVSGQVVLEDFHIFVLGGGFSWGDDHGAGVIQAVKLNHHLGDRIRRFIDDGKLVIGICNGFQTLVNMGLLPGIDRDYNRRSVSIALNDCGNFRDQWVRMKANPDSPCVFTRGIGQADFPVRHGEGKFVTDSKTLDTLIQNNQVVFRYSDEHGRPADGRFPANPNGSLDDIAGICDVTGRIFGLMPHPEGYNHPANHPDWPREKEMLKRQGKVYDNVMTTGVQLFKNGVDYITASL